MEEIYGEVAAKTFFLLNPEDHHSLSQIIEVLWHADTYNYSEVS